MNTRASRLGASFSLESQPGAGCRQLKSELPGLAVVFPTSFSDDQTVLAALEAGADGFLLKGVDGQDIAAAIIGA